MWSEQKIKQTIQDLHEVIQHVLKNHPNDICRIARHYGTLITLYRVIEDYDQVKLVIESYRKWRPKNYEE